MGRLTAEIDKFADQRLRDSIDLILFQLFREDRSHFEPAPTGLALLKHLSDFDVDGLEKLLTTERFGQAVLGPGLNETLHKALSTLMAILKDSFGVEQVPKGTNRFVFPY